MRLALERETDEFVGAFVVDCFGEEEEAEDCADGGEAGLEPEDFAPAGVGYYYAAYHWTYDVASVNV